LLHKKHNYHRLLQRASRTYTNRLDRPHKQVKGPHVHFL